MRVRIVNTSDISESNSKTEWKMHTERGPHNQSCEPSTVIKDKDEVTVLMTQTVARRIKHKRIFEL